MIFHLNFSVLNYERGLRLFELPDFYDFSCTMLWFYIFMGFLVWKESFVLAPHILVYYLLKAQYGCLK
jgi:hypothetical protein